MATESHWHILGAGAIGSLFAHAMTLADIPCTLLLRKATAPRVRLQVDGGALPACVDIAAGTTGEGGGIRQLLVTTKAYDVEEALAQVAPRLAQDCTVLLLVNGMGLAERATALLPGRPIYCGTTTEGAWRRGPGHIEHAGTGVTRVGGWGGNTAGDWFAPWQSLHLDCRWQEDIRSALWHKLAINCAINPLTALHGCRNGELASNPALAREVDALCTEIAAACEKLGYPEIAARLSDDTHRVIAATAGNRSSMLQDASAGRRTEIDFITGYLLDRAAETGLELPRNRALLDQLRALAP